MNHILKKLGIIAIMMVMALSASSAVADTGADTADPSGIGEALNATDTGSDASGRYSSASKYCSQSSGRGQLVPCSRHCDNPATTDIDETEPCSICHIIVLGHNIVEYITFVAVFIAVAIIVFGGVLYIVSAGDQGMISTAKSAIRSALFGIIFILIAWVGVNTLITMIIKPNNSVLKGDWFEYKCGTSEWGEIKVGVPEDPNTGTGAGGGTPGAGGGTPGAGGGTPGVSSETDANGRVLSPSTYNGEMHCLQTPGQFSVTRNDDHCYTSQNECEKRQNTDQGITCLIFTKDESSKAYTHYVFQLEATLNSGLKQSIVPSDSGKPVPASAGGLQPNAACMDDLELNIQTTKNAEEYQEDSIVVIKNCIGVIL